MFSKDLLIENEFLKIEIKYLKRDISEFHKLLNELARKNEELLYENKSLKDQTKNNSSNSSLPPSKDLYKTINKKKKSENACQRSDANAEATLSLGSVKSQLVNKFLNCQRLSQSSLNIEDLGEFAHDINFVVI